MQALRDAQEVIVEEVHRLADRMRRDGKAPCVAEWRRLAAQIEAHLAHERERLIELLRHVGLCTERLDRDHEYIRNALERADREVDADGEDFFGTAHDISAALIAHTIRQRRSIDAAALRP
jgi:hypothetical protein